MTQPQPVSISKSVWVDGQGNSIVGPSVKYQAIPAGKTILLASPSGSKTDGRPQVVRYIKADSVTKEGTVITTKGLTAIRAPGVPLKAMPTQYIAVPIANAATPTKLTPFKTEPSILPRGGVQSSPAGSNTPQPQRLIPTLMNASPRTPHQIMSPVNNSSSLSGKRSYSQYFDSDLSDRLGKRNKKGDKSGKGLRHFSMKVCEKVQKKRTTSYNEVADELVGEFTTPGRGSPCEQGFDQKNIRRRVYDALNVLMAMNIISKEKKEIKWLGLPTNSAQECQNLEAEKARRLERLRVKNQQLHDLILQQIAFKNLVERNRALEKNNALPAHNSAIQLPFIIVNTNKKTVIDCSISSDKSEYLFTFDNTFEIHDDIEVLKRMGLAYDLDKGTCTNLEKARKMVPKALEPYVIQMANGGGDLPPGMSLSTGTKPGSSDASRPKGNEEDMEVGRLIDSNSHISRQSSVGSSSDLLSRPGTSSASEDDFSDSDSEPPSSPGE